MLDSDDAVEENELLVPRSLDRDGRPPSPAFALPSKLTLDDYEEIEDGNEKTVRNRGTFLGGPSKLVGGAGLGDSVHNPANSAEKKPLLDSNEY